MKNTYKNHVSILLDRSSSMCGTIDSAVKVFNQQIEFLRTKSLAFEQETRVSFYTFGTDVTCEISDVDVARPMTLENIRANGSTALLDCIGLAIEDSQQLPQKYGDHSFFIYVITDGEENCSREYNAAEMKSLLSKLPDNYTVAAFVPSINSIQYLMGYGFEKGCIEKWDTTAKGIEEVGRKFEKSMDNFFEGRKKGVRSSKTVFSDLTQVTAKNVTKVLKEVKKYNVVINEGVKAVQIRDLVESKLKTTYTKGGAFYELVKNEHVQPQKEIAIQNKKTGKIYSGDNARKLLNLPDQEVKIVPGDFGEWIVYVQSTSVNRNVIPKQRILVLS
jgi:uncharacterized protein YegL